MPTYGMGDAIREMRIRLGYTQEELAYGICTPGTLSRIENGRAVISKRVFEALCSRIPELHHVWIACDTKTEMQRSKFCIAWNFGEWKKQKIKCSVTVC